MARTGVAGHSTSPGRWRTERAAVDYRVSAQERAAFKRCRRQWDLGSANRQHLQPVDPPLVDLGRAIRDALAVYYYPGMWDWQGAIVLPLVRKAFMRSIAAAPTSEQRLVDLDLGTALLERYFQWAPSLDDFGPLKIETDVEALVPDIRERDRGLLAADGRKVLYTERVAMVAADGADEYWVVEHCVVPEWRDVEPAAARRSGHRRLLGVGADLSRHERGRDHPQRDADLATRSAGSGTG